MPKFALIGALTPLLLFGAPARADWRSPIRGAMPILPSGFTPPPYGILVAPAAGTPMPRPSTMPKTLAMPLSAPDTPVVWTLPLVDRTLNQAEKVADLAPELMDAILRIEPLYDPTRLQGPDTAPPMMVSAGTATMDNVFADHWRRDDPDANVNAKVTYLADAWRPKGALPCDAFTKDRAHGFGDPALTELSAADCGLLLQTEARAFDDIPPSPVVTGFIEVPAFAAPLPGARMSSPDFWAAQKARIAAIQARLRQRWQGGAKRTEVGLTQ